ncbi:MAG TPA: hypothetical protein VFC19_47470 [Candidatus Limnocylindrales bacterium]|nr:hypothetical protein [Candidatus Limnocylindrales bacterium]
MNLTNRSGRIRLGVAISTVAVAVAGSLVVVATPAHASLNLYRVDNASANDSVSPKNATVSCNAGDQMLSVGGRINNGAGDVLLTRAYSDNAMSIATASGIEAINTGASWNVEVFAVCAPAGTVANLTLQQNTDGPDVLDKFPIVNCPVGTIAYGGGFKVENGFGAVAIDELDFDDNLTWVQAVSYDYVAPPSYSLTVQAFCGTPPALYSRQEWTSANNSVTPKTETTPTCPVGTQVSGAGGEMTGALGTVGMATVIPKQTLTTAEVTGREIGNSGNSWQIEAQAVCVG